VQAATNRMCPGRRRLVLAGLIASLPWGCGFQLRGRMDLPFETMYVEGMTYSAFTSQLKRNIAAGGSTRLVERPADAAAVVYLIGDSQERGILAVSGAGRVRELQLRYRVSFRVATATGREWLPVNEVLVVRDLTYDDTQILAKEGEAQMLFRDMQSDAVQQVLRRIQAIRASSGGTAS
jgi:LPS-assembly lipoprotein